MPFTSNELINFAFKGWLGILGSGDRDTSPDNFTWYEENNDLILNIKGNDVLIEYDDIPTASSEASADQAVINFPTVLEKYSATNAIHLTPSLNEKLFFTTTTYDDLSTRINNWIMPQNIVVPSTNTPSWGYSIRLWAGDPNAGGTEINTSVGQEAGTSKVGWFMHYGSGAIKFSSDFDFDGNSVAKNDIWLTGYRYIGKTANINDINSIRENVIDVASIGDIVHITGYSSNKINVETTGISTNHPPFGILLKSGIVITKGLVTNITVQNYDISKIGQPCFADNTGKPTAEPPAGSAFYKKVGYVVSEDKIYVNPSLQIIEMI